MRLCVHPSGDQMAIGETLIDQVVQNNLFVLPVGEDGRWLRYHHLFGEFLRAQFEKERPEQLDALLRRIAAGVHRA